MNGRTPQDTAPGHPAAPRGEVVCHGVTWAAGRPQLLTAPVAGGPLDAIEFMGQRLGLRITSAQRFCTGLYRFVDTYRVEPVPCPGQLPAEQGDQCARCQQNDEFRFAHQFHRGGSVRPALAEYMSQPHWLYIATFANQASKVGTAAAPRKRSRLDEQGAIYATYLAESADGRAVRYLEDSLSSHLAIKQAIRGAAKLAGLADPSGIEAAQTTHKDVVRRATAFLADIGVDVRLEEWRPPKDGDGLRSSDRSQRVLYPHDLREGEHGFTVESCVGSQALVRTATPGEGVTYLLDLGVLKGRRLSLGDYSSVEAAVQTALF